MNKVGNFENRPILKPGNLVRKRNRGNTVVPLYPDADNKLTERNTTLEKLLNAYPDMMIICDKEMNHVLAYNKKVEQETGLDIETLYSKPLFSFFSPSTFQKIMNSETTIHNQEMGCASGLMLPVDINIEPIDWNNEDAMMIKIKNLQEDREIRQVVAGVAHDLNNVFMALHGNAILLKDELGLDLEAPPEEIDGIIFATDRGTNLVRQLQQLTIKQLHKPQRAEILQLVEEIVSSLSYWKSRYNVLFQANCTKKHNCFIDVPKLTEAIFNLIKNAKDAMPQGGIIKIDIQDKPFQTSDEQSDDNMRKGIYLSIKDNGTGISEKNRNKIFSPAFSTKRLSRTGYGFGLANVLRVIKAHGGSICVESKTGEGSFTRFVIFIPE